MTAEELDIESGESMYLRPRIGLYGPTGRLALGVAIARLYLRHLRGKPAGPGRIVVYSAEPRAAAAEITAVHLRRRRTRLQVTVRPLRELFARKAPVLAKGAVAVVDDVSRAYAMHRAAWIEQAGGREIDPAGWVEMGEAICGALDRLERPVVVTGRHAPRYRVGDEGDDVKLEEVGTRPGGLYQGHGEAATLMFRGRGNRTSGVEADGEAVVLMHSLARIGLGTAVALADGDGAEELRALLYATLREMSWQAAAREDEAPLEVDFPSARRARDREGRAVALEALRALLDYHYGGRTADGQTAIRTILMHRLGVPSIELARTADLAAIQALAAELADRRGPEILEEARATMGGEPVEDERSRLEGELDLVMATRWPGSGAGKEADAAKAARAACWLGMFDRPRSAAVPIEELRTMHAAVRADPEPVLDGLRELGHAKLATGGEAARVTPAEVLDRVKAAGGGALPGEGEGVS